MQMLQTLLQHAQSERDAALAARRRAVDDEVAGLDQAEQLLAYRDNYERRWREQFGAGGASVQVLSHYQSFAARLTQAIEQQQLQLRHLRKQREAIESVLAERELKLASTTKLIERRRADEARTAARHERLLDDELAARAALLRLQQQSVLMSLGGERL